MVNYRSAAKPCLPARHGAESEQTTQEDRMASSDNATVDTGIMRQGAATISDHAGQVTDKETAVRNTFDTLMTTWKGNAAQVFDGGMQTFYTNCDTIIGNLQQLSTDVNAAAKSYDGHDDTVTAIAKKMPGLPGF
jgi:WXG100 family type VII secretion target